MSEATSIRWLDDIGLADLPVVGGKNASLGEMQQQLSGAGIRLAPGFATSAELYRAYLAHNDLQPVIDAALAKLSAGKQSLADTGSAIRAAFLAGEFTTEQARLIRETYAELCDRCDQDDVPVAVRSSATAEDLPEASFAGQQESYLNVRGADTVLDACRHCFASLYTDRAIAYREQHGFEHARVALSVGVQQMVDADAAGVMFALDTESGFPDVIAISASWGLGETIVKGTVNPDRYMVFKPLLQRPGTVPVIEKTPGSKLQKLVCDDNARQATRLRDTTEAERAALVLNDDELLQLAHWAKTIEDHYGKPMDMEWARAANGDLYILQARPETVESARGRSVLTSYKLKEKGTVLTEGASVGSAIVTGPVHHATRPTEVDEFPAGAILVTERTDPDWVPIMRKAAGVITDRGGPTSHAAIVSRELKVAAIVGTGNGNEVLQDGAEITLSCAGGATGQVYAGALKFDTREIRLADIPATRTDIMINAAMPDGALRWWQLPVAGIDSISLNPDSVPAAAVHIAAAEAATD